MFIDEQELKQIVHTSECYIIPGDKLPKVVAKDWLKLDRLIKEPSPRRKKHIISIKSRCSVKQRIASIKRCVKRSIVRRVKFVDTIQSV